MMTITEMKEMCKEVENHWFDKDTMKAWGTKIETKPNKQNIFITSEDTYDGEHRRYSIRKFNPENATILTIGDFQQFKTLLEAKQEVKRLKKVK